jgi:transmembrane sensor
MDDGKSENREDELFVEANRWFFRLQAEDVSLAEKQQFSRWLREYPAHAEAWSSVQALMHSLKAPARASYDAGRRRRSVMPGRSVSVARTVPRVLAGCLMVAFCLAAYVQGPVLLDRWRADYVTVAGARESITLADGTQVDLDTDTALKTDLTASERRVSVLRGKAFFRIAEDPRPFVVRTREGESRDIGTAFGVERRDDRSTLVVETGIVDVRATAAPNATARVTAGESVDFGASGLSKLRKADLEQDLAWRRGQLIFRQERLSDVVVKLNRYRSGRIVIVNPWIADELVSGTFNIDRPDAPIDALEGVLGVKATYLTSYLVMLR